MAPARQQPSPQFSKDEKVLCFHMDMLYEAKIMDVQPGDKPGDGFRYKVHYKGWKNTWDDWVLADRIRPFDDEHKELAAQLHAQLKHSLQKNAKQPKKNLRNGGDSARGSEERGSAAAQGGRGGRRGKDWELEQVRAISLPLLFAYGIALCFRASRHDAMAQGLTMTRGQGLAKYIKTRRVAVATAKTANAQRQPRSAQHAPAREQFTLWSTSNRFCSIGVRIKFLYVTNRPRLASVGFAQSLWRAMEPQRAPPPRLESLANVFIAISGIYLACGSRYRYCVNLEPIVLVYINAQTYLTSTCCFPPPSHSSSPIFAHCSCLQEALSLDTKLVLRFQTSTNHCPHPTFRNGPRKEYPCQGWRQGESPASCKAQASRKAQARRETKALEGTQGTRATEATPEAARS